MKAAHPLSPEDVMAYLDGEVIGDEARDIQAHLGSCPECQRLSADLREGSMQLREWTVEEPPSLLVAPARGPKPAGQHSVWFESRGWTSLARRPLIASVAGVVVIVVVIAMQAARKSSVMSVEGSSIEQPRVADSAESAESLEFNAPGAASRLAGREPVQRGFGLTQQGSQGINGRSDTVPGQAGARVVRTATLRIVATDFSGVRSAIERILESSGGFVGSITASDRPGATRSIRGDLRIPSGRFDGALAALRALGRVTEDSQNAEDVTSTVVDLDVRVSNARATEKRLSEVLQNRTGRLSDVLEVEREIMRVRTEIEQMESQRKLLDGRIEYATLTLEVNEERRASVNLGPIPVPTRLGQAIADGLESAAMSLLGAVLLILRGGPVLLLWMTMLGLPLWWLLRRYAFRESKQPGV